jgi:hypothetical protein
MNNVRSFTLAARIFCLFMAFQVLFASTGFAMYEHYCKISGKKTYLFAQPKKSCCKINAKAESQTAKHVLKKAKCCSDQIAHYKITTNASNGIGIDFKVPVLAWIHECVASFCPASWIAQPVVFSVRHYYNTAPPLAGRQRLVFIQSFLI